MSRTVKRCIIISVIALLIIACNFLHKVLYVQINDEKYCILSSEINIRGYIGGADIEKLSKFKRVKDLSVSSIESDISFVEKHPNLENLSLCIDDIKDFTPLNSCKNIKDFGITCNSIDGAVIANMNELQKLVLKIQHLTNGSQIWECSKLVAADITVPDEGLSLKGIGDLDKLNHLYLSGEGKVSDADELCKCDSLTELGIVCEIDDISFLTDLPALEKLYIEKNMVDQNTISQLEDKSIEITLY